MVSKKLMVNLLCFNTLGKTLPLRRHSQIFIYKSYSNFVEITPHVNYILLSLLYIANSALIYKEYLPYNFEIGLIKAIIF